MFLVCSVTELNMIVSSDLGQDLFASKSYTGPLILWLGNFGEIPETLWALCSVTVKQEHARLLPRVIVSIQ